MNPLSMVVGNELGYFYEGTVPDTVVFVPKHCVSNVGGAVSIDDTQFYLSGWAARSARFSGAESESEFAFPDVNKPILNHNDARLKALLLRLDHAYTLSPALADF